MAIKPDICLIICTFNRPEGLRRILDCCVRQIATCALSCEIVVSDNSPSGYANSVIASLDAHGVSIHCVQSAPGNISRARNKGISASSADIIIFLDDDMTVCDNWISIMHAALEEHEADCALSSLVPVSENKIPVQGMSAAFFSRLLAMPDGTCVSPGKKSGMAYVSVATSGTIWRRATCFTDALPFDPEFGASGGEDCDLFLRLENRRKKIIWCGSAISYEWVPPGRMTFRYLLMRAFGGGQIFVGVLVKNSRHPRLSSLKWIGIGLLQCIGGGVMLGGMGMLSVIAPKKFRNTFISLAFREAAAIGKITWFRKYPTYKVEHEMNKSLKVNDL